MFMFLLFYPQMFLWVCIFLSWDSGMFTLSHVFGLREEILVGRKIVCLDSETAKLNSRQI